MSILLCYDGSPSARHAIAAARATFADDEVTLLHVWSPPLELLADSFADAMTDNGPSMTELNDDALAHAEEIADEGRQLAHANGLEVHVKLAPSVGSDWQTILATAENLDAAMIVVGAHPHDEPGPALDSTSQLVVQHSPRPVLVVPA